MGKLSKILAPLAAVLAIAVAVLIFMAYQLFLKYERRANDLASGLTKIAKIVDKDGGTDTASKVTFTAKATETSPDSGTLSWTDYKLDTSKLTGAINALDQAANKLVEQRNDLASGVLETAKFIGLSPDVISLESLQQVENYPDPVATAGKYAKAFKERNDVMVKYVRGYGKTLGAKNTGKVEVLPDSDGKGGFASTQLEAPLKEIQTQIDEVLKRKKHYEQSIASIKKILDEHEDWKSNPASVTGSKYIEVLKDLSFDLDVVNAKLKELKKVRKDLEEANATIREREDEIAKLNAEMKKMKAEHEAILKKYHIDAEDDELVKPALTSIEQVDVSVKGSVLVANDTWNYVVVSLGNRAVVVGTKVIISRNGKYLASGEVVEATKKPNDDAITLPDECSLVNLSRRVGSENLVGADVFIGNLLQEEK
ncbi:MAG: hypothetical protein IJJ33_08590 [Victivallales bacterium]|nr:hypothetical protein [Victivallales bacterium]